MNSRSRQKHKHRHRHTYRRTHTLTHIHNQTPADTYRHTNTQTHTDTHTDTHTHTHTQRHRHIHADTHTHRDRHRDTHRDTHTEAHTQTHTELATPSKRPPTQVHAQCIPDLKCANHFRIISSSNYNLTMSATKAMAPQESSLVRLTTFLEGHEMRSIDLPHSIDAFICFVQCSIKPFHSLGERQMNQMKRRHDHLACFATLVEVSGTTSS